MKKFKASQIKEDLDFLLFIGVFLCVAGFMFITNPRKFIRETRSLDQGW